MQSISNSMNKLLWCWYQCRWLYPIISFVLTHFTCPLVSSRLPLADGANWGNLPTAFCSLHTASCRGNEGSGRMRRSRLYSDWSNSSATSNSWQSIDNNYKEQDDWQEMLVAKEDGSFWKSIDDEEENDAGDLVDRSSSFSEDDQAEAWLDTLAGLAAEEVEFNQKEAERADTVLQMQEWGFESDVIESALGVAVDDSLEAEEEPEGMQAYREESYDEEIDYTTVESHTTVERDPDTGEPICSQMVYVDEHKCVGCYQCPVIADSMFFMDDEYGRARVFQQWGDTEETIEVAIDTCPVDCIHYIPYEELVQLEVEQREQVINFKAQFVNAGASGATTSGYLDKQEISDSYFKGDAKFKEKERERMEKDDLDKQEISDSYFKGDAEFEEKERERMEKDAKKRLQEERERQEKSVEL